jgi:hypothetical protein
VRVNIVCKPGWILERMAREIAARVPEVRVNAGRYMDPRAALNYYMPTRDFEKCPTDGPAIGLYTHGDTGFDLIGRMSICLAMNRTMSARLEAAGAPRVDVVRPGIDPADRGPIVFGVIGRVYNSGRKGEALVRAAVESGYRVVACGPSQRVRVMAREQWPCAQPFTMDNRADFYRAIDYLLVPSLEEGGPMPVIEAIAHGVPVIAPDVGWCWEFPVIRYACGDWSSLDAVLRGLTRPPTWEAWADAHARLFREALGEVAA